MSKGTFRYTFCVVVGFAAILRYRGLFANTFHADEALFASWARLIAVWRDPLLLTQTVDKPPLLFYLQALFYPLLGPVEWAGRLPNFVASLLLVPLVARLVLKLYRDRWVATVAAIFVALSPLAIQFSATAFTDPLLTAFLLASLIATSNKLQVASLPPARRLVDSQTCSGFFFGLAIATKHQAWLFLPLLLGLAVLLRWRRRDWSRWLAGFIPVLLLLLLWEVSRTGSLTLWPAQIANFGGLRPIWSWELWPRFRAWLTLSQYVFAPPLLLAGTVAVAVPLIKTWRSANGTAAFDLLFILYLVAYGLLHWLLAIPIWDRYLLAATPVVALVLSRGLRQILDGQRWIGREKIRANLANFWFFATPSLVYPRSSLSVGVSSLVLLILLAVQLPGAWQARAGRFPIGGQPDADQGASHVALALGDAPYGTVLYDHWYSWQWRYHLFDRRVYVSWFPHPAALVEDLAIFGHDGSRRYLALPNSATAAPVRRALTSSGFQLQPVPIDAQTNISLYQIITHRLTR
ncbi:MAG TPA: glycosyltransferase family 39 protein [Anaerolineae bacterium]